MTNVETVIGTMGNLSRVVAIEEEKVAPGSIAIGRYEGKHLKEFGLLFLGTDATWPWKVPHIASKASLP